MKAARRTSKKGVSGFRLYPATTDMIEAMSRKYSISKSSVVDWAVREFAASRYCGFTVIVSSSDAIPDAATPAKSEEGE